MFLMSKGELLEKNGKDWEGLASGLDLRQWARATMGYKADSRVEPVHHPTVSSGRGER